MPNAPKFRLSRRAAADLESIASYTIEQFGIKQARRYRDGFERTFQALADRSLRGRSAAHLGDGVRRFDHESHVIFYRKAEEAILIARVLHRRMDMERYVMTDD